MAEGDTIRIKCPSLSCQRILAVPGDARGKLVRCRVCGSTLRIPQKSATDQPAEAEKQKNAG